MIFKIEKINNFPRVVSSRGTFLCLLFNLSLFLGEQDVKDRQMIGYYTYT
jgi:hypothetical protein